MRKIILVFVIILAVAILYLNRAYARIFSTIGARDLINPTIQQTVSIPSPITTSTAQITYVALGDSLTAGVGATYQEDSYPYRVAKLLVQENSALVTIVNLGKPGAVSADVLNQQLPQALSLHPDVVTLAIGINDMLNRVPASVFGKNISTIADDLAGAVKHVNIINIPYLGGGKTFWPPYRYYFDRQTRKYNGYLVEALAGKNVFIIDLYTQTHERALNDSSYYSADGFHPSEKGYEFWSNIIYGNLNY